MDRKGFYNALLCVLWVSLALLMANPGFAQSQEQVTTKELEQVVDLMEDPQKREIFLKNLRSVIQAQDAAKEIEKKRAGIPAKKEREVLVIEILFSRFESISRDIMGAATSTVTILTQTPSAFVKTKSFLSQAENLSKMLRLVGGIAVGMVIALILRFLLRGFVPRLTPGMRGIASKVILGFLRMILVSVPYVALIGALFILFRMFPSFSLAHSLSLLFFGVLFLYRVVLELFRVLLSPDNKEARIMPFSDENAQYAWVWTLRFIHYTAFYALLTRILVLAETPAPAYAFIRTLLLLVFPLMISVFIMQVSREIRVRYDKFRKGRSKGEEGSQKWTSVVIRYWAALAIAYAWAIFLFLIVNYETGFHYLFKATLGTTITIVALLPSLGILGWVFKKFFAINERVKARFPGLEEKTNRYILMLRKAFRWILIIIALGVIAYVWGIPISSLLASKTGSSIILRAIAILITVGVVIAILETSDYLKEYYLKPKKGKKREVTQKRKTLLPMLNTAVKIAAGFIGGIVILDQLGVNTTPILAGAGIVGLAVGFGSQTLVRDLINGLFILFEDSVRVGDYADLGKNEGMVESVGLRTIRLRDVSGNVHVVPNSSVDTVTNMSKEFSRTVIDVGVAYREDVDEVMEILRETGEEMRNDPEYGKNILEPIEIFGLHKFDDSAIVVRARLTTKPLKQWGLKREFNRRVKKVFDQRGIEIPFPHRTIYMGEPKQGPAPPLHVEMKEVKEQGLQA